jgi:hypothetical protein
VAPVGPVAKAPHEERVAMLAAPVRD